MRGKYDERVDTKGWDEEMEVIGSAVNSLLELVKFEMEKKG
jgi:hypothetical protein